LCFCPIYGTLCTIPFLLSACITKALLFKHGKETYIYDKGQLLWKSYFSRINTAHWHKLKTTNKHDYNSHQTNLLILLPWQAKPSQANLLDFAMSKPTRDNMAGMQAICLHLLQRGPIHTKWHRSRKGEYPQWVKSSMVFSSLQIKQPVQQTLWYLNLLSRLTWIYLWWASAS